MVKVISRTMFLWKCSFPIVLISKTYLSVVMLFVLIYEEC